MRSRNSLLPTTLVLCCALVSACNIKYETEEQAYSIDGIRLITRGDSNAYGQQRSAQSYTLDPDRRLLLRLETFSDWKSVSVTEDKRVWLQVVLDDKNKDTDISDLKLCPLRKDWMMLATWYRAHPFSDSGIWENEGGDFDPESCTLRTIPEKNETPTLKTVVRFDITQWYKDYARGRGTNYGFVLVAERAVEIYSETSGSYSPRLFFSTLESVWEIPEYKTPSSRPEASSGTTQE
jgi:hypothetical protein